MQAGSGVVCPGCRMWQQMLFSRLKVEVTDLIGCYHRSPPSTPARSSTELAEVQDAHSSERGSPDEIFSV